MQFCQASWTMWNHWKCTYNSSTIVDELVLVLHLSAGKSKDFSYKMPAKWFDLC